MLISALKCGGFAKHFDVLKKLQIEMLGVVNLEDTNFY